MLAWYDWKVGRAVTSQREDPGFESVVFLCEISKFSMCLRGWSLGSLASSHKDITRLTGDSKLIIGVNVSVNELSLCVSTVTDW